MRVIHNVSLSAGERDRTEFLAAGVALPLGFTNFKIEEGDPRWSDIEALVVKRRAVDIATTKFDVSELNNAEFLGVEPTWHYGYPMPDEDRGFLRATFDLTNYCKQCGIGKKQIAPFRIKRSPVWGKRSIYQLNWIFDEYFVKPELWLTIFKPFGIASRPVVFHKTGEQVPSVLQLENSELVELNLNGVPYEQCSYCTRKKYRLLTGFYPKPASTKAALFKSTQYFGSGANAYQMVLASASMYKRIHDERVKGVNFKACAH